MKKIKGFTIGGLQQKIFNIVLVFALAVGAVMIGAMAYQSYLLSNTMGRVNETQQKSIEETSSNTMHSVVESTLVSSNEQRAEIAGYLFDELEENVNILQALAVQLFEGSDSITVPHPFSLPDKANDGKLAVEVLWEEGVDYQNSRDLGIAAYMSEAMLAMSQNSETMDNCYFGLADGTYLLVDFLSSDKFDENGNIRNFPVRQRPWYKGAVENNGIWFSDLYEDVMNGSLCITCSAPVYAQGRLIGVVGFDMYLDTISEIIESGARNVNILFIVDGNGHVIFATEDNGLVVVENSETAEDLRESENESFAQFITDSLEGPTGLQTVDMDGTDYYMVGSPIKHVGWSLITAVQKAYTEQPTEMLLSQYREINEDATNDFLESSRRTGICMLIALLAVLVIGTIVVIRFTKKIVSPLEGMVRRINDLSDENLQFTMQDEYRTKDEIEELALAFAELSKRTVKYIGDIQRITAERERVGTELKLATDIQAGMLPNLFPAFPERPEFDIYATMDPAKEVGGDFYDFFLIDNDHLGMVIADVSGKGVPAALFMMSSKILINDHALMGGKPSEILSRVNKQLCENNVANMFVTVWLGILEISTGKFIASNGGHEYPMLKVNDGYEMLKDKHGPPLGIMKKSKYTDYELSLKKGDSIFTYTDGVAEATDAAGELFGTGRTLEALNAMPEDTRQTEILKGVRVAVDAFVKDAPQFDDITMLGLKYFGPEESV